MDVTFLLKESYVDFTALISSLEPEIYVSVIVKKKSSNYSKMFMLRINNAHLTLYISVIL